MTKLILKSNLQLVALANENNGNSKLSGLYKTTDGYLATFVHGNEYGDMSICINGKYIDITPKTIRDRISNAIGIRILNTEKIMIAPCFPARVKKRWGKSIKNNNMKIICNNWNSITGTVFCNDKRELEKNNTGLNYTGSVSLVIGKYSDMLKLEGKGTLDKMVMKI